MAQQPLSAVELRQLCGSLMTEARLLPPLDPHMLCSRLGEVRGRPIRVGGADLGGTTSLGHLVAFETYDRIIYERAAPHPQQAHVIFHEVIHLVRGHLDADDILTCGVIVAGGSPESGLYSHWQEWEAETGATILSELMRERRRPNELAPSAATDELGIAGAFGLSPKEWS